MVHDMVEQRHDSPLQKRAISTPLPKAQLSTLLYLLLAEPITATVILPFIVQVSTMYSLFHDAQDDRILTACRGNWDYWREHLQSRVLCRPRGMNPPR